MQAVAKREADWTQCNESPSKKIRNSFHVWNESEASKVRTTKTTLYRRIPAGHVFSEEQTELSPSIQGCEYFDVDIVPRYLHHVLPVYELRNVSAKTALFRKFLFPYAEEKESVLEQEFKELAQQWYKETGMISMIHRKVMHPAYQRIIGMGKDALPFIFRELQETRGHWLWALISITGTDAAQPGYTFREAVDSWLQWGQEHGYL